MLLRKQAYYFLISIALLVAACHASRLNPNDYVGWVEDVDNQLIVSKTIDDFDFKLQYKPLSYIVLRENGAVFPGKQPMEKRLNELNGMQYYTLRIASNGSEKDVLKANSHGGNEYFSRLEYFSSIMQNDLILVDGNDTLPCLLFHYERNYNLAPYTNFLLGFEESDGKKNNRNRTLIYNDQVLGCGTVQLSISDKAIDELPALKEQ